MNNFLLDLNFSFLLFFVLAIKAGSIPICKVNVQQKLSDTNRIAKIIIDFRLSYLPVDV
jgi:hypothetical protein